MCEFFFWALEMFLRTILKHYSKPSVRTFIESDHLTTGWPIPWTSISQELFVIETSNLKQIKEKRKAVMIDYQFVTLDLLTYFYSDFTLMCRTIYCLVSSLSSNTHLWIACEHFNLHVNFWPIDLIKFSAQRLNFPWKFSCLVWSIIITDTNIN